jgi:hypothetical protein
MQECEMRFDRRDAPKLLGAQPPDPRTLASLHRSSNSGKSVDCNLDDAHRPVDPSYPVGTLDAGN